MIRWRPALNLLVVLLTTTASPAFGQVPWPTREWEISTPEAEGLSGSALDALDRRIRVGEFGYIDRVVVTRHGRLVFDGRYDHDYREISRGSRSQIGCGYGCEDPSWDHQFNYLHPDWHPYHQGRQVHTLQSVTKSVSATLIGVAIGRGEIPGVDAPLLPFLDGYDTSRQERGLADATLEDVLTMRTGIEWHETDRPMNDSNTTIQLERSPDWVQFTLDQPMDARPGEKWVYNSGGSQLMSAILRHATGADFSINGRIVEAGPAVRITAELRSADGARVAARQLDGPLDDVLSLIDQLSLAFLQELLPGGFQQEIDVASLASESPQAIGAYLTGMRDFRAGRATHRLTKGFVRLKCFGRRLPGSDRRTWLHDPNAADAVESHVQEIDDAFAEHAHALAAPSLEGHDGHVGARPALGRVRQRRSVGQAEPDPQPADRQHTG